MFCNFLGDFCFSALGEFRFFLGFFRGVSDFEVVHLRKPFIRACYFVIYIVLCYTVPRYFGYVII